MTIDNRTPDRARRHHLDRRAVGILQQHQVPTVDATADAALRTERQRTCSASPKTLELMRHQGCGPKYVRLSPRTIRYLKSDLSRLAA